MKVAVRFPESFFVAAARKHHRNAVNDRAAC